MIHATLLGVLYSGVKQVVSRTYDLTRSRLMYGRPSGTSLPHRFATSRGDCAGHILLHNSELMIGLARIQTAAHRGVRVCHTKRGRDGLENKIRDPAPDHLPLPTLRLA